MTCARALMGVLLLAACDTAPPPPQAAAPAPSATAAAPQLSLPTPTGALPAPNPGAAPSTAGPIGVVPDQVPSVYMAVQAGKSGPASIIFAIDASKDNTPSDDTAIRITPEAGKCNPQELKRFTFPAQYAKRPVFSIEEAKRGIGAPELPKFMAMAVTSEMLRLGIAAEPQATQPQNVCTRKLWEQLVLAQNQSAAATGQ